MVIKMMKITIFIVLMSVEVVSGYGYSHIIFQKRNYAKDPEDPDPVLPQESLLSIDSPPHQVE